MGRNSGRRKVHASHQKEEQQTMSADNSTRQFLSASLKYDRHSQTQVSEPERRKAFLSRCTYIFSLIISCSSQRSVAKEQRARLCICLIFHLSKQIEHREDRVDDTWEQVCISRAERSPSWRMGLAEAEESLRQAVWLPLQRCSGG